MTEIHDITSYTIGWIAALYIERAAATALLDEVHPEPDFSQHQSDTNAYTWGRMGKHNIVIASIDSGVPGAVSAAVTVSNLLASLPHIKIGLLVGLGGAIARPDDVNGHDIRLGDVVVSKPTDATGGVVQYDLGKAKPNQQWELRGTLNKPPSILLRALSALQSQHEMEPSKIPDFLRVMWKAKPQMEKPRNKSVTAYIHQGVDNDRLFQAASLHAGGSTCAGCDKSHEILRDSRDTADPEIHYGIIASGNTLVTDAAVRDMIAERLGYDCMCVEMEAAGIMDQFPCLVIRGICDYADSHKNDQWQRYASATAAAFGRELLDYVPKHQLKKAESAVTVMETMNKGIKRIEASSTSIREDVYALHSTILDSNQRATLTYLNEQVAAGASFDSHSEEHNSRCLPNTRVELLQHISEWILDTSAKPMFWLNGMAGTGKSTILRTVAESLKKEDKLGASFFFKRGEADRGTVAKFFSTIAADLVRRDTASASHIKTTIENDPAIFRKALSEQFSKLVLQPISIMKRKESIVILVDALDECDDDRDIKLLIELFSRVRSLETVQAKVILTSRPDLPIRLGFAAIRGEFQDFVLHDIPDCVTGSDISCYLEKELGVIRKEFNNSVRDDRMLPADWPGQLAVERLVAMAIPLFIFAATACRFIGDRSRGTTPDKQLERFLAPRPGTQLSRLGATYLPVLENLTSQAYSEDCKEILDRFHNVIGTIVVLQNPLSECALARLLDCSRDDVAGMLDLLHSVLVVPSSADKPIKLLHLSFRDFLLTDSLENPFWVDEKQTHAELASNCLRVMDCLRQDMCDLRFPGAPRSDVESHIIQSSLSAELQYACSYWVHHMRGARTQEYDCERVYCFLKRHFLHWLEALSLMGRARQSILLVQDLQVLYKDRNYIDLDDFLNDAERFVLAYSSTIDFAPLQLYSSLLIFSPVSSEVRSAFEKNHRQDWITLKPLVNSEWGQAWLTLEGHGDIVTSVAFSPDSRFLVSTSQDGTVRTWRADTGEQMQTLESHADGLHRVTFSLDATLIASVSDSGIIQVFRVATGELIGSFTVPEVRTMPDVLEPSIQWEISFSDFNTIITRGIYFKKRIPSSPDLCRVDKLVWRRLASPDGRFIASASEDWTIRLWRADTGDHIRTLQCPSEFLADLKSLHHNSTLVFSPDSDLIAVGFLHAEIVYLLQTETGECVREIQTSRNLYDDDCVAISPDNTLLALFYDSVIEIHHISGDEEPRLLVGHGSFIKQIAFSSTSKLLASTSQDSTIRLWKMDGLQQIDTGTDQHDIIRSPTTSVALSPDLKHVASSHGGFVNLWNTDTGEFRERLECSELCDTAFIVAFSPDSRFLASITEEAVFIWCVITGEPKGIVESERSGRGFIVFSPDSKSILVPLGDELAGLWDIDTQQCVQTFGKFGRMRSAAFSPDMKFVMTTTYEANVDIWLTETGHWVRTVSQDPLGFGSVAFSSDSKLIALKALRTWIKTVSIRCAETGEHLQTFELDCETDHLLFDDNDKYLRTGRGAIALEHDGLEGDLARSAPRLSHPRLLGLGISADNTFITWNGLNLIWIPKEFRKALDEINSHTLAISGTLVAFAGEPGVRVTLMKFSATELDRMAKGWRK